MANVRARRVCSPTVASSEPSVLARLVPADPQNARISFGGIKANLDAGGAERVERLIAEGQVTESLQQAAGDVVQAADILLMTLPMSAQFEYKNGCWWQQRREKGCNK
jgi:hypothetical protein